MLFGGYIIVILVHLGLFYVDSILHLYIMVIRSDVYIKWVNGLRDERAKACIYTRIH